MEKGKMENKYYYQISHFKVELSNSNIYVGDFKNFKSLLFSVEKVFFLFFPKSKKKTISALT